MPRDNRGLTLIQILVGITVLILGVAGLCFAAWYAGYNGGHPAGSPEADQKYVVVHDPSYEEMRRFVESDDTDKNEWTWPDYVCMHFARDVKEAATAAGMRCALVYIDYHEMERSHFLIAFETTDKGLIFVEPQTDEEMRVEPGRQYVTTEGDPFLLDSVTTIDRVVITW